MNAIATEPYKALIVAMLEQAIRDISDGLPEVRQVAYRAGVELESDSSIVDSSLAGCSMTRAVPTCAR